MKRLFATIISLCCISAVFGANTIKEVNIAINYGITVSTDVDYVLGYSTPFTPNGYVNITNTEHAVVIFKNIKPSVVKENWLKNIRINGNGAIDGTNCQVKMYGRYGNGTIVMPYSSGFSPLTCYSGKNYTGTTCNSYTTGSDGGYMKTLTTSQLNNNIRSFKLKRGYMVSFAVGTGGWGYSRCFIADTEDLEMAELPAVFDGKISSYRIFEWYDAQKKGVSGEAGTEVNAAVNSSWTFTWGVGESRLPNVEMVPHKIQKYWPGNNEIGSSTYSAHAKTDNEPANSADDNPATYTDVLNYWEDLMRTGQRLCSPSTYDGNNNAAWFDSFFNEIDARGWRCDIYDIHCYWANMNNLESHYNKYKRPIWISELMWGASWNKNGIFSVSDPSSNSSDNQTALYNGAKSIVDKLNSTAYVERYAWWNSENVASKIYYNGSLTKFGEYYASMTTGLAYNKQYEYVPKVVIKSPSSPEVVLSDGRLTIQWTDPNGDMVDAIKVKYCTDGSTWKSQSVTPKDKTNGSAVSYTCTVNVGDAEQYSVQIVDEFDGKEYSSPVNSRVNGSGWITTIPSNLSDFYFFIYSQEASSDLCWTLGWKDNNTDISYQKPSTKGTDLKQAWILESNGADGYGLRNLAAHEYVMCSPNSWNFITNNDSYHTAVSKANYLPEYDGNGYWTIKNVNHSVCYVGLWDDDKSFAVGERLAGNRNSKTTADHLKIYAMLRTEFDQIYVNNGNKDMTFALDNPSFTWGVNTGEVGSGGGKVEYPTRWTFKKTMSGWEDMNVANETVGGKTISRFNAWAGTFTYAELYQTLNNIPNGVYKISADCATTKDYARTLTKTAIFGAPTNSAFVSRSYNLSGTGDSDFKTYECYVVVDNNTLNVGIRSDGTWFKVTNFNLEYICPANDASEEVLGYIDNGRALQAIAWSMDKPYFSFLNYPNCRNLQIDQTAVNAIARMAATATYDKSYRNQNVIVGDKCENLILTDNNMLTIGDAPFTATKATYKTATSQWSIENAIFQRIKDYKLQLGDVNHDGSITAQDVKMMVEIILGVNTSDGLSILLSNISQSPSGSITIENLTDLINLINK